MLEFSRIIHQQIWRDILVEAETPIQDLNERKKAMTRVISLRLGHGRPVCRVANLLSRGNKPLSLKCGSSSPRLDM